MDFARTCVLFLVGVLLAVAIQVFLFSPISPQVLEIPSTPNTATFTSNALLQVRKDIFNDLPDFVLHGFVQWLIFLQGVTKLGEGILEKPEDVIVDKRNGMLYTATRDGWIKRLHRNGSWENWKWIGGRDLLGLDITPDGDVVVCDADKGLLKVGEREVTIVGGPIRFADDVIAASDGCLYFSVASTKFQLHNWFLDVLEAKPHGQLLKYDPSSDETSVLLDGLFFANGVALSQDEDYLIVCESSKFRCLKYWLKGKNRGQTETFIDNLPGAPDNIKLAPDGSFWIALLDMQFRPRSLNFIHKSKAAKHVAAMFPHFVLRASGIFHKAMAVKVTPEANVLKFLDDPTGKVMSMVTSALEFEDHLYLGTLGCDFIGKIQL